MGHAAAGWPSRISASNLRERLHPHESDAILVFFLWVFYLMRILFAISILSFLVLVWAAVAITRRIRASHKRESSSTPPQPEFSQYLFSAVKDANSPSSQNHSASRGGPTNQSHADSYTKTISAERG
jgi:hypothetical protein